MQSVIVNLVKVIAAGAALGETPVWDHRDARLWFSDILSSRLYCWDSRADAFDHVDTPQRLCSLGLCENPGRLVCAFETGFYWFEPASGAAGALALTTTDLPGCRMNDGRVDRVGRFWAGSMVEDEATPPARGKLYRYDGQGNCSIHLDGISISNGICWSPDGRHLYFSDSPSGVIRRYAVTETGLADGTEFARGLDGAHPDGAVVDSEGFLWSAQWGRGAVVRYSPRGDVDYVLEVPCPQPTCVAFGGPDHRTLFVTSARIGLSSADLARYPESGAVFVYETDVVGIPEPLCTVL